jgi:transcriptional regulator with XRE-family HTH domain
VEDIGPDEGKTSKIQRLVMDYLEGVIGSSREFEEKTGISHALYHRYKEMKSIMTLAKLEHIFSIYPILGVQVGDYLRGNTDKKLTNDGKAALSKDEELLQSFRDNVALLKLRVKELEEKNQILEKERGKHTKSKAGSANN